MFRLSQAEKNPVAGNLGGSYLTMWSSGGLMFGIINVVPENTFEDIFILCFVALRYYVC